MGRGWGVPAQGWATGGGVPINTPYFGNRRGNCNHESELEALNTNLKLITASMDDLRKVIHLLDQKIEILWSAPGMPGSQEAKAAFEADVSKATTN